MLLRAVIGFVCCKPKPMGLCFMGGGVTAPTPACRGCVFCLCVLSVGVPVTVLEMTLECAPRRRDPDLMRLCLIGPS